ncbi:MAG: asparagine synthase (glutamine-hydrolyzing) [Chloroflexi bacterium]|nr:asparagine synthase (glutamine-hydrolyzing) [Chloroflexota bacterium]
MCGICGVAEKTPSKSAESAVLTMNSRLAHRGPDSEGHVTRDGVALAMRRLAIIDLHTGDQPIITANGDVAVILNGEIYNFRELREDLERAGCTFRTRSDTEVVALGYLKYGTGVVDRLKGMFAFALHDRRSGKLLLARDRFGEKPLYYHHRDSTLIFASEMRALLAWPELPRRLNREAFGQFLRLGYTPSPTTLVENIQELPPGCFLEWDAGAVKVSRYYTPDYTPAPELGAADVAIPLVREALKTAVGRQMVSDVPIGALLSGGIDSSAVVAMMQQHSDRPVSTFTVRFSDADYDESAVAREVARHLGTDHHEISIDDNAFQPDDLWRIVEHVGQPFADSSAIPMYVVSRSVREHVKVCLTGDGGDEMFAGYPIFNWASQVDRVARIPRPLRRAAGIGLAIARHTPGLRNARLPRQATRALGAADEPPSRRLAAIDTLFLPSELRRLIGDRETLNAGHDSLGIVSELPDESMSGRNQKVPAAGSRIADLDVEQCRLGLFTLFAFQSIRDNRFQG